MGLINSDAAKEGTDNVVGEGSLSTSVIICTRNRAASLETALKSLQDMAKSSSIPFETIIVDNGSTDDTENVVARFLTESKGMYIYEPRPGLSYARNKGLSAARGEILLFTDEDCLPDPTWVKHAVQALDGNLLQVIGGRVELYDAEDFAITIKTSLVKDQLKSIDMLPGFMHGCNMIIGRPVFGQIGTFDVRLGAGTKLASAEDSDLIYRAFKAGIPVIYDPNPVVFHDHGRIKQDEVDKLDCGYRVGLGAIAAKYLLKGDIDPAKSCYWQFRSIIEQWLVGKVGFSRVIREAYTVVGGCKFLFGQSFRKAS